ncbi:MAG TPA: LamG domain-containing protein [Candidatus Limnocylindria bacterium]|nr:LamG domain-containing protein [Candidatus Limnocylindria bacterium]
MQFPLNSTIPSGLYSLAIALAAVSAARADTYSTAVLQDNPLGYYRLNDVQAGSNVNANAGSLGAAGNATNLNTHLVPGAIVGSHNPATYFDSTARSIIPWNAALNPSGDKSFTIEAWFYPTSDKVAGSFIGPAPIMNRYSYPGAARQGWVYFQRNPDDTYSGDGQSDVGWNFRTYTGEGTGTGINITTGVPYRLGEWQHVVTVWDGPTQTATIFVNGVEAVSGTYSGGAAQGYTANTDDHSPAEAVNGASGLSLGSYNNTQPGENPFRGAIDEVAFYSAALTGPQILAHYQNATNSARTTPYDTLVKSDNPVAYLRMDDPPAGPDVAVNVGALQHGGQADNNGKLDHPGASPLAGTTDTGYNFHFRNNGNGQADVPWTAENNPDATVPFTVEAWFRPTNDRQNPGASPINNRLAGSAANRTGWVMFQRAPNESYSGVSGYEGVGWNFRTYTGSGGSSSGLTTGVPYSLNEWQHVVTTWDGASTLTMYVNGELAASSDAVSYAANTNPPGDPDSGLTAADLSIGSYNKASNLGNYYEGGIDEVAIYNGYQLTAEQIKAHYAAGTNAHPAINYETLVLTAPYDGQSTQGLQPASYWRFNDPAPLLVRNSGVLGGKAAGSYEQSINGISGPVTAGFAPDNKAANLDGTQGWISLDNPAELKIHGAITLEAWIKPAAAQTGSARIISHGPPTPSNYVTPDQVEINGLTNAPNEVYLSIDGDGASYSVGTFDGVDIRGATAAVPAGDLGGDNWIHLVGINDGTVWKLYRNGDLIGSSSDPLGALVVDAGDWAVGATGNGWGQYYAGGVDEVAIYDHALAEAKIKAHYQAGTSTGAAPTLSVNLSAGKVTVSWPAAVTGYTLQSTDSLAPSNWTAVSGVSGNSITLDSVTGQRFYRLIQ